MNNDQHIRALAAQAAATLMAPLSPSPEDYFAVADSIAVFIEQGPDAAVALALKGMERRPVPAPAPVIQPGSPAEPVDVAAEVAVEPPQEPSVSNVIQLGAREEPPAKQTAARLSIEKIRKERVKNLMGQASVAKAKIHKQKLIDEAEEAGLNEYTVVVAGAPTTLGAYLASL